MNLSSLPSRQTLELWMRQVWAVMRLEIGKSFFSKRGLWIYILAIAPVVIWAGHAWDVSHRSEIRRSMASKSPGITKEKMAKIEEEMTREQVIALLGEPPVHQQFTRRFRPRRPPRAPQPREAGASTGADPATPTGPSGPQEDEPRRKEQEMEWMRYSDGQSELYLHLTGGKVDNTNLRGGCSFEEDSTVFAVIFQFFYLRLAIFFGCVFVFMNLFRGEMLDKSLHYYFLAPVRREVVVAGKYAAGLLATSVIFGVSIALQFLVMNAHFPAAMLDQYISHGHAARHLLSYMGVTALACAGYGSAFLVGGILLRNPLIPAGVLLLWESINGILPAMLRKVSVIYYLKSLCPVAIPQDKGVPPALALLAFGTDPVSAPVAIAGVTVLAAALLLVAAWRSRGLEINYGTE